MILAATFLHEILHPYKGLGYQFWSGIGSDIGEITLVGIAIGAYRHVECHKTGCHRFGRFVHGHYKLCAVHHPKVPSDGKINQHHIDKVTHSDATPVKEG